MPTTIRLAGGPDDSLPLTGTVLLEERSQYGVTVYYPANDLARGLLRLTGRRTVVHTDVAACKALGLTVMTVGASPRQL